MLAPKELQSMPQQIEDIKKDFPDWYLKPLIEEGLADANASNITDGKLVFKRLREKYEKKYGKLRVAMWSHS